MKPPLPGPVAVALLFCVGVAGAAGQLAQPVPAAQGAPAGSSRGSYYYVELALCAALVLVGGLLAGLTLGLMSLDQINLRILATSGTPQQRACAQRIQPIRQNGHWLLVSLLLANTIVNEALPIAMNSVLGGGGVLAVVVSTAAIVLFGEIIPQSLCARHGLAIGAYFAYPVRVLQLLLAPLAYPVALLLDWVLGPSHSAIFKRAQLKELVSLSDAAHGGNLSADEITIIRGALELRDKLVADVMTELDSVYMVDTHARLDRALLAEMVRHGHSRVPVFSGRREDIVGVLLVKSLVLLDPDDCTPVSEVTIEPAPLVTTDVSLYDILNAFQEGGSHMAIVMGPPPRRHTPLFAAPAPSSAPVRPAGADAPLLSAPPRVHASASAIREMYVPMGIVTLEDVIEELIQEEIVDETDVFIDIHKHVRVVRATTAGGPYPHRHSIAPTAATQGSTAQHSQMSPPSTRNA